MRAWAAFRPSDCHVAGYRALRPGGHPAGRRGSGADVADVLQIDPAECCTARCVAPPRRFPHATVSSGSLSNGREKPP